MQARIAAIAGIHRRLYTSEDVRSVEIADYLASLLAISRRPMEAGHARPSASFEPTEVPTDKAVSIGVMVTELVTNAYKYAYPTARGGEIRVVLRKIEDTLELAVEDDGVLDRRGTRQGTGLGTRIVNALARGLGSGSTHSPPQQAAASASNSTSDRSPSPPPAAVIALAERRQSAPGGYGHAHSTRLPPPA